MCEPYLLQVGERQTVISNPAIGVLNLVEISPQNQGEYQCRATYLGIGTIVSEPAKLTVLGFLESISDMDLTTGGSHTIWNGLEDFSSFRFSCFIFTSQ